MVVYSVFRSGVLVCAAAALLPAWAQQSSNQMGGGPTRMQRCQAEIGDVKGSARTLKLRKCLIDRTEGERLLTRDCSRQFRALPTGHKVEKAAFQKQCVLTGLKAGTDALPRRKVAAPAAPASGAASTPGKPIEGKPSESKPATTKAANKPVDKPVSKSVDKPMAKPAPSTAASPATSAAPSKP